MIKFDCKYFSQDFYDNILDCFQEIFDEFNIRNALSPENFNGAIYTAIQPYYYWSISYKPSYDVFKCTKNLAIVCSEYVIINQIFKKIAWHKDVIVNRIGFDFLIKLVRESFPADWRNSDSDMLAKYYIYIDFLVSK